MSKCGQGDVIDAEMWKDYDVEAHSPRMDEWLQEYQRRSQRVYLEFNCRRDIAYGTHPRQRLDFFPSKQGGNRVLVYIHGGFWRRGDKSASAHPAAVFVPAGWNFATVEYPLVSDVPFADIVRSVEELAKALPAIAAAQGIADPCFVFGGQSAGAHLAACAAAHIGGAIAGLILLGGVYDLAPLLQTPAQEWLQLTPAEADQFSPVRVPPWPTRPPALIAVGGEDRPGLRRQGLAFHRRLQQSGHDSTFMLSPGDCHFSIIGRLADPNHPLGHAALRLLDPANAL